MLQTTLSAATVTMLSGLGLSACGGGGASIALDGEAPGAGFPYSVASGDPTANAVVLWTRLARSANDVTPISDKAIAVEWMVATDEKLSNIVNAGITLALPEFGHSVHVDVLGLDSDRCYWYAFRREGVMSPVGRTRTLPAVQSSLSQFRFNVVSCQHFEAGYFNAYEGMANDDAAFVMHLGDYIYDNERDGVRSHWSKSVPKTLNDYRLRHAQYKTDPWLRKAHETMPFFVTLDNHDALEDNSNPDELARRAAAYQAWYEFQPVRYAPDIGASSMLIRRTFDIGQLMRVIVPDTRQYKDAQKLCTPVSDPGFAFGVFEAACPAVEVDQRYMLGREQEAWLKGLLTGSSSRWNVIGSTVMMTPMDMMHNNQIYRYLQSWDGYPAERGRILDAIEQARVSNPICLSGDIHSSLFSEVVRHAGDDPAKALMAEFLGTSVSSVWPDAMALPMQAALPSNPHIKFYDYKRRGYMRCTVTKDAWTTDVRNVDASDKTSATLTTSSHVVENGSSTIHRA